MVSPVAHAPWVKDAFLEQILGKPVYRLIEPAHAKKAIESAGRKEPWMIETKVPVAELDTLVMLCHLGFRLIDTNVQLDCSVAALASGPVPPQTSVREARREDRQAVERIAADNLVTSRFHLDEQVGPELGSRIKRAWVANYFEGRRGDGMWVVEHNRAVAGFLLVLERGPVGVIDLIALDTTTRGLGAAGALIGAWLAGAPTIERVVVGTQISNVRSLRAYGKLGFRMCSAAYVLHCHRFASDV